MELTVDRKELLKAINGLKRIAATGRNDFLEIKSKDGKVYISKTDKDRIWASYRLNNASVVDEGSALVETSVMKDILSGFNEDIITISSNGGESSLFIRMGNSSAIINCIQEKSIETEVIDGENFKIDKSDFIDLLKKVIISADTDQENLATCGVKLIAKDNILEVVATDTYRLSYAKKAFDTKTNGAIDILIPAQVAAGIIKMKTKQGFIVEIAHNENQFCIQFGNLKVKFCPHNLQYPDYNSIISNSNYDEKILLNTKEFKDALKRVLNVCKSNKESKNGATFDFHNNKLTILGQNEALTVNEGIKTVQSGEDLRIALNVKFLLDYLNVVKDGITELHLLNKRSSVKVKGNNEEDSIYFTMPLALRD
ncbi:DNA polymerase III subunit beta [Leptotrichia sp. oral taxon 218]|uniref:DNA polymerase III subunit beta n=1 Tax=Leptotrichia sp. oral taxon 218 TaxID=712361 RepID=UPI001B8AA7CA|nr:DNA polymerase III subunit beta [Leptotrichia sp. oral taxon 218]QUB95616.1 DNA polymerase III subunit beta [Leptotrichia sp. oral taxon 218]